MSETRKLAHIERIEEIIPIEGADRIVQYRVLGWKVISKKDEFRVGDLVVYIECDSFVPNRVAPFLTKPDRFPKEYGGIQGERLKTIRMKGVISQGLLLPIGSLPFGYDPVDRKEGEDFTELLGIIKWEPPAEKVPVNAMGSFPYFVPKTDSERVQTMMRSIENFLQKNPGVTFTVTEKLEGSSHTMFAKDGEFGICSRNLRLKIDDMESREGNHFLKPVFSAELDQKIIGLGRNLAFQSEVIGEPAIQGNIYQLTGSHLYNFNVWDIDNQKYLNPSDQRELAQSIGMNVAPLISDSTDITGMSVDDFLSIAGGKTLVGSKKHLREGLVFVANCDERFSFKVVDNEYLLLRGY